MAVVCASRQYSAIYSSGSVHTSNDILRMVRFALWKMANDKKMTIGSHFFLWYNLVENLGLDSDCI